MPVLLGLASMAHLARDPRAWSFIFFYGRCVIHPNFFRKKNQTTRRLILPIFQPPW
jgi:hypothetical protein